jgi:UDP-N-acetylglucosamine enolpyruvyl transferase
MEIPLSVLSVKSVVQKFFVWFVCFAVKNFWLAAVTGGRLLIKGVRHEDLRMIRQVYGRLGIQTTAQGDDLLVPAGQSLEMANDLGGAVP